MLQRESGRIALLQFDQLSGLWHGVVRGCGVVAHLRADRAAEGEQLLDLGFALLADAGKRLGVVAGNKFVKLHVLDVGQCLDDVEVGAAGGNARGVEGSGEGGAGEGDEGEGAEGHCGSVELVRLVRGVTRYS
jgi:hypothetical protein